MGFYEELLREMKTVSTITSWRSRKQARNGAIPAHQTQKNSSNNQLPEKLS